jgi:pyruvate/2-oxoglutarate dehydrogenase complex dihydrolipoamide dehydrogenase (E3) component
MRRISKLLWIQVSGCKHPFFKSETVKAYMKSLIHPNAPLSLSLSLAEDFDRVIGIHIVSPSASEAIQGFALAMKKGLFKRDLDAIVGVHPTVTEALMNGNLEIAKSSGKDPRSKGC